MKNDNRPSWDEYFMEMAEVTAKRSTCLRRQVGAVIVQDKHIIATGYNGAPRGIEHCGERPDGCLRASKRKLSPSCAAFLKNMQHLPES